MDCESKREAGDWEQPVSSEENSPSTGALRDLLRSTESTESADQDQDECIPGVPDDVMLDILSRTPRGAAVSFRQVSRAWRRAANSDALRASRVAAGRLEQWLFVLPEVPEGGPFRALDPVHRRWHVLPPIPLSHSHSGTHPPTKHSHTHPSSHSHTLPSSLESTHSRCSTDSRESADSLTSSLSSSLSSSPSSSLSASPASSPPRHGHGGAGAALEGFACVAVAGKLLVIGGMETRTGQDGSASRKVTSAVWEFDPASWRWCQAPSMGTARGWCAASVVGDRYVFVTGGQGQSSFLRSAEVFDAECGQWRPIRDMALSRSSHRAVTLNNRVIVIAGELQRHDTQAQQQQQQAPAPLAGPQFPAYLPQRLRPQHLFRQPQAQAHALPARPVQVQQGQFPGNALMEMYDAEKDEWVLLPDSWLNANKVPCPVAIVSNRLYAVQGSTVHVWKEEERRWSLVGDTPGRDAQGKPYHVSGYSCAELAGRLLLIGGARDVWLNRTRLTQQNLGTVQAWEPPVEGEEAQGGGFGLPERLMGAMLRSTFRSPTHSIMMWKDMPSLEGGGGPILASAVVSF